jgi:hypothetical protein
MCCRRGSCNSDILSIFKHNILSPLSFSTRLSLLSLIIRSVTRAPSPLKSTAFGHHLAPSSHRFPTSSLETSLKLLDAYAIVLKVKTELSSQISL